MNNARIEKQVSSLNLSDTSEIKKLLRFAYSRKFYTSVKLNQISFFPGAMIWNKYLTISVEEKNSDLILKLKEHKFLVTKQFIDREVSIKWLKGFFNFRAQDAQKDIDYFLEQQQLNEKIIKENKKINLNESPQENILVNKGLASGNLDFPMNDEGGPLDDNWDSGDWEEYMSGPDFEDGQPQW